MSRYWFPSFRLDFFRGQKENKNIHDLKPISFANRTDTYITSESSYQQPPVSSYAGIQPPTQFPERRRYAYEPPIIAAFQPFNGSQPGPSDLFDGHHISPPTLGTVVEAVELNGTVPIIPARPNTQPQQNEKKDTPTPSKQRGNTADLKPPASNLIAGDFEQPYSELFQSLPSPEMYIQSNAPRESLRDLLYFNEPKSLAIDILRTSTVPPVQSIFTGGEQETSDDYFDTSKPTCTLNIVCYRSGARGCQLQQLQTARESKFKSETEFQKTKERIPGLICNDRQFFEALREAYLGKMCGFWRRAIFLKSLRGIRLLSITPTTRPTIVPLDDFIVQEVLYAYQNPSTIETEHDWIDWVFRLRQPDRRHALEFVEGWNGTRIAIAALTPLLISCVLGILWSWKTGDVQTAFTVAGFVLTAGTLVLALLAIISGIEASGRAST